MNEEKDYYEETIFEAKKECKTLKTELTNLGLTTRESQQGDLHEDLRADIKLVVTPNKNAENRLASTSR